MSSGLPGHCGSFIAPGCTASLDRRPGLYIILIFSHILLKSFPVIPIIAVAICRNLSHFIRGTFLRLSVARYPPCRAFFIYFGKVMARQASEPLYLRRPSSALMVWYISTRAGDGFTDRSANLMAALVGTV